MKRILITGANSFVGNAVQKYLQLQPDRYIVDVVGTRNNEWLAVDFSLYDVVYHVAGIAHSDVGNVSELVKKKYYAVNTDLTIAVAEKAKIAGVRQFIFMSSAIVYGDSAPIGEKKIITANTKCSPTNFYGDSKVQAEKGIMVLNDQSFHVVILRCPMIYGKGSKGNFPILEKIALKLPFFPKIENMRSMLYVGNLTEFVRLMIDNEEAGIFWPCNREWSNTSSLVKMIADSKGKRIILIPGLGWILKLLSYLTKDVNKAFGNLAYEKKIGDYKEDYRLYSLEDSIKEIEG